MSARSTLNQIIRVNLTILLQIFISIEKSFFSSTRIVIVLQSEERNIRTIDSANMEEQFTFIWFRFMKSNE